MSVYGYIIKSLVSDMRKLNIYNVALGLASYNCARCNQPKTLIYLLKVAFTNQDNYADDVHKGKIRQLYFNS